MSTNQTKFLFFTGKGGVGKTSIACSTAVSHADKGDKVLLISTDPASNLADVLQYHVSEQITEHSSIKNLFVINIDPEVSAEEYRSRVLNPMIGVSSEEEIKKIKEGLSGACTTEIASFDEFSRFITGEGNPEKYDVIIFDTAPTGHTIRLLELPAAWSDFLEKNPEGASCIGPSSALKNSKERYEKVLSSLRDQNLTTFYLVSRTDRHSIKEAARTSLELQELGFFNQGFLINGVYNALDQGDSFAVKMEHNAKQQLANLPEALSKLKITYFPLLPYNILGADKLRSLFSTKLQKEIIKNEINDLETPLASSKLAHLIELVNELENDSNKGLIMTMGKGGVGKTIVAATIATILANRCHQVLLTTTDPAAHINDFINQLETIPSTLTIERIDPKVETQSYVSKIIEQKGQNLDAEGKKLLLEDLKSPCTEEVAVFNAFSKAIHKAKRQFVVMDTAPTGHTLLLLDTTGSYHKEIMKKTTMDPSKITTPYMFLQDQSYSKILLISLPETTPMREAESLQNDLLRAGIKPYAWVVNQCLSLVPDLKDPILRSRALSEDSIIHTIQSELSERSFGIPYITEEKLLPSLIAKYV